MKKIVSVILSFLLCLILTACGEEKPDGAAAFENMRSFFLNDFKSENYYIQKSKTQAESHVMTEISMLDGDCAFLEYDATGSLKFFRNDEVTTISPETYYIRETKEAEWSGFSDYQLDSIYSGIMNWLCKTDYSESSDNTSVISEINVEKNDNENFPYKVSVHFDPKKIDTKEAFGNGGNFGSISIKFLCSDDGKNFDDISLNLQYDYNSTIYVAAEYFGEPNLPDKDGNNGQRPEDIQEIFDDYAEDMEKSYEEYLKNLQSDYSQLIE